MLAFTHAAQLLRTKSVGVLTSMLNGLYAFADSSATPALPLLLVHVQMGTARAGSHPAHGG